jgi:SPP1 gp7 family putative phage head morphogenesis protein
MPPIHTSALPIGVTPERAVEFFRAKGYRFSFAWQDLLRDEHAKAFTVAKVMRADILEDLRAAVDKAIATGTTLAEFRRELTPLLQRKGWWGRQLLVDPQDGEEKRVQLGSPRRLETIYDTNLRTSYAAGRWGQIQDTKHARPYLRYVAVLDSRTRPLHRLWNGTVLPVDHPFWRTHFPPNGWRCRCGVQQLNDRDLGRYGYQLSPDPKITYTTWTNPRSGAEERVPFGIDPGFDYNPGIGSLEHLRELLAERIAAAPESLQGPLAS